MEKQEADRQFLSLAPGVFRIPAPCKEQCLCPLIYYIITCGFSVFKLFPPFVVNNVLCSFLNYKLCNNQLFG